MYIDKNNKRNYVHFLFCKYNKKNKIKTKSLKNNIKKLNVHFFIVIKLKNFLIKNNKKNNKKNYKKNWNYTICIYIEK